MAAVGIVFLSAASILAVTSGWLPNEAITQAGFATMPAPAAYLKDVVAYFMPLSLVFMLIPYHLIHWQRADESTHSASE